MDKIVGRLDVSSWKHLNCTDAMDQVITLVVSQNVNVETKNTSKPKLIVNVETKRCVVKLVRLDSILFDNESNKSACVSEEDRASTENTGPEPTPSPLQTMSKKQK